MERILAPDVARGFMLLGIAVANAVTAWLMMGSPPTGDERSLPTDEVVIVLNDVLVHTRGLPMFATLFGYGIGMLVMREYRRGAPWPAARALLLKRYGWLALFGVIHAIFLFFGDILLLYSLLGLIVTFLVPLKNRTLLWIAGVLGVVSIGISFLTAGMNGDIEDAVFSGADDTLLPFTGEGFVGQQLVVGVIAVVSSPFVIAIAGPQLMALMLVGLVAARMRVLEESAAHVRLLSIVAAIGITAAVVTGVPAGLDTLGVIDVFWVQGLSDAAGLFAGPGLVALIALVCLPTQRRIREAAARGDTLAPPLPLGMLQALGQRSMSGYVTQSVLFLVLAGSWSLDLFTDESVTIICLWATGVWLFTLIAAWLLAKAGKPGPLEAVHRRLTYGPKNGKGGRRQAMPPMPGPHAGGAPGTATP